MLYRADIQLSYQDASEQMALELMEMKKALDQYAGSEKAQAKYVQERTRRLIAIRRYMVLAEYLIRNLQDDRSAAYREGYSAAQRQFEATDPYGLRTWKERRLAMGWEGARQYAVNQAKAKWPELY